MRRPPVRTALRAVEQRVAMRLEVGDMVVYGSHGVGRVEARDDTVVHDVPTEVVVLALEGGLKVTLPLEYAREQLRQVADKSEVRRVEKALGASLELRKGPWLARRNELAAKLNASDPVQLAEIVVEGAQRQRLRAATGNNQPLSPGESSFFAKARQLLAGEMAVARGVEPAAAERWIEERLAP